MNLAVLIIFALAAIAGATLAVMYSQGKPLPRSVVTTHGLLAATGLVLLLIMVVQGAGGLAGWALGCFVVAALGGATLLWYDWRGRALPWSLIGIHASVAVLAFVLLLIWFISAS